MAFHPYTLEFKFDAKLWDIKRSVLRAMKQVPPGFWNEVEEYIKRYAAELASDISRNSVSEGTVKWREWQKKKGIGVPTYAGQTSVPIGGSSLGMRTGTFLGDLGDSSPPGVEIWQGTDTYSTRLKGGVFHYKINAEAFANAYPRTYFQPYLISRGILEGGGFLELSGGQENDLEWFVREKILNHIESEFNKG